jgi:hypothetical protein
VDKTHDTGISVCHAANITRGCKLMKKNYSEQCTRMKVYGLTGGVVQDYLLPLFKFLK